MREITQLETRLRQLEMQVRLARRVATAAAMVLIVIMTSVAIGGSATAAAQDARMRRVDAQTLYVSTIVLQDALGQMRGMIDTGPLGESQIQLFGPDRQQRVALSARGDSGSLFLSGGTASPSLLLNASSGRVFSTGFSIRDQNGIRLSAGLTPSDVGDGIAKLELTTRRRTSGVYMSARDTDGSLQVSATSGSIRLDSEYVSTGQSEPRLSVWHEGAGQNRERIQIGMVNGQPKIELLPETETQR